MNFPIIFHIEFALCSLQFSLPYSFICFDLLILAMVRRGVWLKIEVGRIVSHGNLLQEQGSDHLSSL